MVTDKQMMNMKLELKRIYIFLAITFGLAWIVALIIYLTGGLQNSPVLIPGTPITLAFVLLNLGALARVFGPLLVPTNYTATVHLAGGFWLMAFAAFVIVYAPILLRPRADGRPD